MTRLRTDANVRKFIELRRPWQLAKIANLVVETFDQYRLIHRIRLNKHISPVATGNDALRNQDPSETSEDAIERFLAGNKSPQLQRYLTLANISDDALTEATDRKAILRFGPSAFFSGVENDLADICVR